MAQILVLDCSLGDESFMGGPGLGATLAVHDHFH